MLIHRSSHCPQKVSADLSGESPFRMVPSGYSVLDLLNQAPVAMALIREHKIVIANQAFADILDRSPEEVAGTCYRDYLHPEDIPYVMRLVPGNHRTVVSRLNDLAKDRWIKVTFSRVESSEFFSGDLLVTVEEITELREREKNHYKVFKEMYVTIRVTLLALGKTLAGKDPYTQRHQIRVSRLAFAMAKRAGYTENQILGTLGASRLHDIGKIAIPSEILCKPIGLNSTEWELIKAHPERSADIIGEIPFGVPVKEIVLQHHERLDGSGYPYGLKGDQILPEARILAVADIFEAMTADRPYRPSLSTSEAFDELLAGKGTKYDPVAVDVCRQLIDEGFSFEEDNVTDNPDISRYLWRALHSSRYSN